MKIDLHIHTSASDGSMSAGDVINKAFKLNLDMIAIADHDTIDSVDKSILLAQNMDLVVISGIEFSTAYDMDLHILGYFIDHKNPKLNAILEGFKEDRLNRIYRYVDYLKDMDVKITFDDIRKNADGDILGRVHIAKTLVQFGYCKYINEAFETYLSKDLTGKTSRKKITAKECIALIHDVGGISVLAHPCYMYDERFEFHLNELISYGLNGIEIYHPDHTDEQTVIFEKMAKDKGLIGTSGSDFHGKAKPDVLIGSEQRSSDYLEFCSHLLYKKAKEIYK